MLRLRIFPSFAISLVRISKLRGKPLRGKVQNQIFPPRLQIRKLRGIRTFTQPRRRRVSGYISNVS